MKRLIDLHCHGVSTNRTLEQLILPAFWALGSVQQMFSKSKLFCTIQVDSDISVGGIDYYE